MADDPAAEASHSTPESERTDPVLTRLDYWQKIAIAIAGLLTLIAQLWLAIQKEWRLTIVTLALAAIVVAIYFAFFRRRIPADAPAKAAIRWATIATLIGIPLLSLAFLLGYSYLPRATATGNTIAVSRFDGPPLPAPYESCRPSAMLVHALAEVADRFHRLSVFEVSYNVDPDRRWAATWAKSHGWLDAADVIVYGDYDLGKSDEKIKDADEITLNPRVDSIPTIPIADKVPPLYSWDFPRRTVPIAKLCGSPADSRDVPEFVDDARRLALAVVSADLFAAQDYEGSERALTEAKASLPASACDSSARESPCRGVLAFYLANVDLRFGHFADAEREYRYAADHLVSPTPLVSLGELDIRLGHPREGFENLDRAVRTDPTSVAALATRALYERDYLHAREAAIDLDRALTLPARHFYDISALSRALYQRGGSGDTACGLAMLQHAISSSEFDRKTMLETYVRYGVWLAHANRTDAATHVIDDALKINPYSIKANYEMGVAMRQNDRRPEATAFLRRALFAPAFTDEDFLDRANAAHELRSLAENRDDVGAAQTAALDAYQRAIDLNPDAVYAKWDRGRLEDELGRYDLAERDYRAAAERHPFDATLLSTYSSFLAKHGKAAEAQRYRDKTRAVLLARIPADEASVWSNQTCRYARMGTP